MITSTKKIAGIILAAGTGTRMGQTKQLLPYKDTTILGKVLSQALVSDLVTVFVVLGHEAEKIQQHLNKNIGLSFDNMLININYKRGQSTSLIKGITRLSQDIDGAMFLLGDQPLITPAIINHLIAAYQKANAPIAIPFYNGKRGNPVIISKTLFPQLKEISKDTGARVLFKKYDKDILKIPVNDTAVLTDIDTPEDYQNLVLDLPLLFS